MTDLMFDGFQELSVDECEEVNGGFPALTIALIAYGGAVAGGGVGFGGAILGAVLGSGKAKRRRARRRSRRRNR